MTRSEFETLREGRRAGEKKEGRKKNRKNISTFNSETNMFCFV